MKNYQLLLLSILSGLLFSFGWFPNGLVPLLFVAFVPLLIIEKQLSEQNKKRKSLKLFCFSYLTFFLYNLFTTWWIKNASFGGAVMAVFCNALLMTFVIMIFSKTKKRVGEKYQHILFISFWLTFEFIHHHWDLSWPWLTLGNAFADSPMLIQWYEYTGIFGGSLWILIVNCIVFSILNSQFSYPTSQISKKQIFAFSFFVCIPILTSFLISAFNFSSLTKGGTQVVIVQPNIDPYNEKFTGSYVDQLNKMLRLAKEKTNEFTEYLILPETALTEDIWENELEQSVSIKTLKEFLSHYPKLKIIIGASTARLYKQGEKLSATARKFTDSDDYYDAYNTALQLDSSVKIQVYHKSKLVLGVEKIPFPSVFKYFEKLAINLGGTIGSLGFQENRTPFVSADNTMSTAPVICYEGIYGEFVSDYINNGAQFISIITNDGWWGDTPGYKQHLKLGALRAIETRKWIARSANTGISCFIAPNGEIKQPTKYWTTAVISQRISLSNSKTFYTRFGDYIARIAMSVSVLLIAYSWLLRLNFIKK